MMKWSQLLKQERLGKPIIYAPALENKYPSSDFQKDSMRILNMAAYRRLQDKTQVFPLDRGDFVRTRLTHSQETAEIGKTLSSMVSKELENNKYWQNANSLLRIEESDIKALKEIPEILFCAGLLHDIGNPPFGHFGEEIIQKWFEKNLKKYDIDENNVDGILGDIKKDFHCFDGNAQALRLLTRLHYQDSEYGLNLAIPTLHTMIKYPTFSHEADGTTLTRKKMGCFLTEKQKLKEIETVTGVKAGERHPLVFLLEAADDIAYKTADIEDGLKKGLYSLQQIIGFAFEKIEEYKNTYTEQQIEYAEELFGKLVEYQKEAPCDLNKDSYAMQRWIPYAKGWLMYVSAYSFTRGDNYKKIMSGEFKNDLFEDTFHTCSMRILGDIMAEFIFPVTEIIKLELAANTILTGLLDRFVPAVLYYDKKYSSKDFLESKSYKKLYSLLSDNYKKAYTEALSDFCTTEKDETKIRQYDIYLRLLLVVDQISGMTDSFAKQLYQELAGI